MLTAVCQHLVFVAAFLGAFLGSVIIELKRTKRQIPRQPSADTPFAKGGINIIRCVLAYIASKIPPFAKGVSREARRGICIPNSFMTLPQFKPYEKFPFKRRAFPLSKNKSRAARLFYLAVLDYTI